MWQIFGHMGAKGLSMGIMFLATWHMSNIHSLISSVLLSVNSWDKCLQMSPICALFSAQSLSTAGQAVYTGFFFLNQLPNATGSHADKTMGVKTANCGL